MEAKSKKDFEPHTRIVSRKNALEIGLARYFTGKRCVHGHLSERQTISGSCLECRKTVHRDKIKEASVHRYENNPFYWEKMNKELLPLAKNARNKWQSEDLHLVLEKAACGGYRYTARHLAKILKRSYRSIERIRAKYKNTPYDR